MTDEEVMVFCGTICKAASNLRIYGRIQYDHFMWFDPSANRWWKCDPAQDKKTIMLNACNSLVEYLTQPPK